MTDGVSREPIPFVNIYLNGKNVGTTSDFEGNFSFQTSTLADTIIASSVGYQLAKRPMRKEGVQTIHFVMERADISLKEIEIRPGENPAHVLLRKIVKNKARNSNRVLDNYSYESYNKVELDFYDWNPKFEDRRVMKPFKFIFEKVDSTSEDKPFLPIFLTETLSDYYYRSTPKNEDREVIKATKQAGLEEEIQSESLAEFLKSAYQEVNIYDNWPEILEKRFVSPINDNGLLYYNYYLVDSGYIDEKWCYKMTFKPKGKGSLSFVGDMWIVDSSFAVKQISMEAAEHVNVNFVDRVSVFEQYIPVNDTLWMLSKDKIVIRFKLTDKAVGVIARKTSSFKDYRINRDDIDSFFIEKAAIRTEQSAFDKDTSFWTRSRHELLTSKESGVYEMVDSIMNTRAFKTWIDIFNVIVNGYYPIGKVEIGPIASIYSRNGVDNNRFRLGIRTTHEFSKLFRFGIYAAYGLGYKKDLRFKYGAEMLWVLSNDPRHLIGVSYVHDLDLWAQNEAQLNEDNILNGLVRRNIPQKLNMVDEASVFYEKEWKVGYSNKVTLRHKVIKPQFDFYYLKSAYNGNSDTIREITAVEGVFRLRFAYREKFIIGPFNRVSLGTKYPELLVWYTLGVKGIIGSEYNYHKIDLALSDNIPVSPIGTFHFTLITGKTFGKLPFLLLNNAQGNESYFYKRLAFNIMNENEFVADFYTSLFVRHHFEGFFLNRIPGIRKLKWREIIFANAFWGSMSDENKSSNDQENPGSSNQQFTVPYKMPYVEVGFGIENIFKVFEVNVLWRVTHRDNPDAAKWGILLGLKLDF